MSRHDQGDTEYQGSRGNEPANCQMTGNCRHFLFLFLFDPTRYDRWVPPRRMPCQGLDYAMSLVRPVHASSNTGEPGHGPAYQAAR